MTANTAWASMPKEQRLIAAAVDVMSHKDFALLSGVFMMGNCTFDEGCPTAATDGRHEYYSEAFMAIQNRKQTRWVRLHENFHKALHHCTEYKDIMQKFGMLANVAQDFVINAMIDEIDPQQAFAERPVGMDGKPLEICLDKKYYGWSFIEVLRDLLKNAKPMGGGGKGSGSGPGGLASFDEHMQGEADKMTFEEKQALKDAIEDALRQGKMVCDKIAGREKGGSPLDGLIQQRRTDWREPLRRFVQTICAGDNNSRYCPPNKIYLPHGIFMPTRFDESTGELHVYCDTSGSMMGVYPVVFGEIARICETVRPEKVRVIWWDTEVCGEQEFLPENYDNIATMLQPKGGGGTHPNCVLQYVTEKGYKPKCGIWLTDGYLDGSDCVLPFPAIWGVVDNDNFVPAQGQVLRIDSANV